MGIYFLNKSNNKELANDQFPNESWRKEANKFSRRALAAWEWSNEFSIV